MKKIKLAHIDTNAPGNIHKNDVKKHLKKTLGELDELQNLLYAESKNSILVILQGMDASGKDGLIRDVCSSMNPQGVNIKSFKQPTAEELSHDFLWRIHQHTPAKGMIHVFNRSHYEDIIVSRVHHLIDDKTALKRMQAINEFERMLIEHNNTTVLKFYLHISHKEQKQRLEERMQNPLKMWKYNAGDFVESKLWGKYMSCYEDAINSCNVVPWHIIPSDQNWYRSYMVAHTIKKALESLKMKYPGMKK